MGKKRFTKVTWQRLISWVLVFAFAVTTVFTNTVTAQAAKSAIVLNEKKAEIAEGKSIQLKVTAAKGLKNKAVTWKSSDKKVASVNNKGKVTAKKAGSAKITATSKSNKKVKATCNITVKKNAVKFIQLDKTACVIVKGKSANIKVQNVFPSDASKNVVWSMKKKFSCFHEK